MSVTKKFAALGAAAAISATGLVAATGTSAHAANVTRSVSYDCDLSSIGLGPTVITTEYSVPTLPAALPKGTAVPSQPISAKITVPASVTTVVAVGLYHMVLEGVVLLAGQNALLDTLSHLSVELPGVRRGVELVLRDERWHIGFGTRLVQGSGLGKDEVEAILALGQAAAGAWGDLVSPDAAERAVHMHRNRLRSVGRKFF